MDRDLLCGVSKQKNMPRKRIELSQRKHPKVAKSTGHQKRLRDKREARKNGQVARLDTSIDRDVESHE